MPKAKPVDRIEREPEPETGEEKRSERISFPVTDDGSIDFSQMRPGTVAKLKAAVEKSGLARPADSEGKPEHKFPRSAIPQIYDSIAVMTRVVGKMAFAWPNELCAGIAFTPEEKTNLTEPTGEVIDKYMAYASKYAVEINFLSALSANLGSMVTRAVEQYKDTLNVYPTVDAQPQPTAPAERPAPVPEAEPSNGNVRAIS